MVSEPSIELRGVFDVWCCRRIPLTGVRREHGQPSAAAISQVSQPHSLPCIVCTNHHLEYHESHRDNSVRENTVLAHRKNDSETV